MESTSPHPRHRTQEVAVPADSESRRWTQRLARAVVERRLLPWLLAYLAGAWVVWEATGMIVGQYGGPPVLLQVAPVVLAFGVLSTLTLAWYHGAAGWQRVTRRELVIHGIIGVLLAVALAAGALPELAGSDDEPPPLNRVAVLYYKDHTENGAYPGLTRDLTERVVHELAQVKPLDVLPLAAVAPFRGDAGLGDVVRRLDTGAVVEGSVARVGDSVLVTTQLVEGATGTHLDSWNHRVAADSVEDETGAIAVWAADRIRRRLGTAIRTRELEAGASDEAALRHYRLASEIVQSEAMVDVTDDPDGAIRLLSEADSLLAAAERRDPDWAAPPLLRSRIAEIRSRLADRAGERDRAALREAVRHAERALRTGTDSAAALEQRGTLRYILARHAPPEEVPGLLEAAEGDLRSAYRLDDQRAQALSTLSAVVDRQGKLNAAYEYAWQAVEADAFLELGSGVYTRLIEAALQLERIEDADRLCALVRRRFDVGMSHWEQQLLVLGSKDDPSDRDVERAWEAAEAFAREGIVERQPEHRALGRMMVAPVLARAGLADSAEAVIRRAGRRLDALDSRYRHDASYYEAAARLQLGQREAALDALRDFGIKYAGRMAFLATDWWFRELWSDPDFVELTGMTAVADRP